MIEEAESTTVIGPGGKATVDAHGNIVITLAGKGFAMTKRSKNTKNTSPSSRWRGTP